MVIRKKGREVGNRVLGRGGSDQCRVLNQLLPNSHPAIYSRVSPGSSYVLKAPRFI